MRVITYICALIFCSVSFEGLASDVSALQQAKKHHRTGYNHHMAKDHDEAMIWYKKGAAAGLAKSEFAIARLLTIDREGPKDYTAALPWVIRAAKPRTSPQGYGFEDSQKYAREMLDWICKSGVASFPETMPQSQDSYCLYRRGRRLYYGSKKNSVKQDYIAAQNYLHLALEKGEPRAAELLMRIYGKGLGTEENPELYQKMMRIAADNGDGNAIMALASQEKDKLSQGQYINYLNRAAYDGHKMANRQLGDFYMFSPTNGQDIERAITHYFLAGRTKFPARYSIFSKHRPFKSLLEDPQSSTVFNAAKLSAELISKDKKFSKRKRERIAKSYDAISSRHIAIQENGGRMRTKEEYILYAFLAYLALSSLMRPLRFAIFLGKRWLYILIRQLSF